MNPELKILLQAEIDIKTKPLGSLGKIERLAFQVGMIQGTVTPVFRHPAIFVFAADHGIARLGVSAYPPEVTAQMVINFTRGGAAINVFCRQHNLKLKVVDAGVAFDLPANLDIIDASMGRGTANFLNGPAMSAKQCREAIRRGKEIICNWAESFPSTQRPNIIGFGEMGIGNTSSAAMLMHKGTQIPLSNCIGRGTGVDDGRLQRKHDLLQQALKNSEDKGLIADPYSELAWFGGFEIAMMVGAMLEAAKRKMIILVDGFISSAAFLTATRIEASSRDFAIFCHCSDENGHQALLNHLDAQPLLNLQLRLGEGTGCALAYPLVQSSVAFLNEMASFSSAGISSRSKSDL